MRCRFATWPLSPAVAAEVAGQLSEAFDAQLLDEVDERVVFRHQLVHDAIYQHVPPPARRLLHREAAVALMAAGADRLDVADHLMLGAERGDEAAVGWLRDAAREASAQAPLVTVELLRRAEALLPGGHRDADLVSAEVVQALLRAGRWPRRRPVPKRCSPGSTPPRWTPRCGSRLSARWLSRTAPTSSSPWSRPASPP